MIVACICLGSVGIAGLIARAWDPCMWISAVWFGGGAGLLGVLQYRGTFRYDRNAATVSTVLLAACCGLLLLSTVVCSGEFLLKEWRLPPLEMLAAAVGVAALTFPALWLNALWTQALARGPKPKPPRRRRWQISLQELLVLTAALGLSLAIIVALIRSEPGQVGEHVETDSPPFGIPPGAQDICWHQYPRGTMYYEFTAEEQVFREWVQEYIDCAPRSAAKEIRAVTKSEPFEIYTYKVRVPLTDTEGMVTVTDGLMFDWHEEDRGVHAVWERPTKRVYFNTHSH